ncbi:CHAP domain-containing protein [Novosphingobium sp. H3SJ31-1]|uniref:CHAP domain-containing protein n=1 Tax=Novosphingobium album (ex Liu et al. 2023) TaxID=3031130 RepID=A0ABT5WJJ0_9SPHN|nr:CHAP domain-containing protein [Novosphingobium album (ex Liu et al. 2023)]
MLIAVFGQARIAFAGSGQYLQCVPYARATSGIQIHGDAWTWWEQAQSRYERGTNPRVGAVMAFEPYRNMNLGHVAVVSRIVDQRTVLVRHANWSPINGMRGQIENDVVVLDVSRRNDWSTVRVWYAPLQGLGNTDWPVSGFIYPRRPAKLPHADAMRRPDPIGEIIAKFEREEGADRKVIRGNNDN